MGKKYTNRGLYWRTYGIYIFLSILIWYKIKIENFGDHFLVLEMQVDENWNQIVNLYDKIRIWNNFKNWENTYFWDRYIYNKLRVLSFSLSLSNFGSFWPLNSRFVKRFCYYYKKMLFMKYIEFYYNYDKMGFLIWKDKCNMKKKVRTVWNNEPLQKMSGQSQFANLQNCKLLTN